MLNIKDLTLHYKQSQILNGISLSANVGKVTCVMGRNGVGKTSLLKAIAGVHHRSGGDITLDGRSLAKPRADELAHLGVAYVPQGREIFPCSRCGKILKRASPACRVAAAVSPTKSSSCFRC